MGWVVALDDRDAGRRLWRPLFYRLRASGSIHKATDATGQQHRQLKVYDLGAAHTMTASALSRPSRGSAATVAVAAASALGNASTTGIISTPSPSQQGGRSSSLPGRPPSSSSAGKKSPSSCSGGGQSGPRSSTETSSGSASKPSYAASTTSTSRLREASACVVCGLIQREGYSGRDCEMCASALVVVRGGGSPAAPAAAAAATPRLAYTRVNLSGAGGSLPYCSSSSSSSSTFSPSRYQHQRKPVAASTCNLSPSAGSLPQKKHDYGSSSSGRAATDGTTGGNAGTYQSPSPPAAGIGGSDVSGGLHDREERELGEGARSVDWHFLVKRLAEEKRIASGWGSLHHGWVWLQRSLQVRDARYELATAV